MWVGYLDEMSAAVEPNAMWREVRIQWDTAIAIQVTNAPARTINTHAAVLSQQAVRSAGSAGSLIAS
jgi:hypothetical protein